MVLGEEPLRLECRLARRPREEDGDAPPWPLGGRRELVQPPQYALIHPLRLGWLLVVLVIERYVIKDVLAAAVGARSLPVHPSDPVTHDRRGLVGKGRVVGLHIGDYRKKYMRLAIVVLEAFAEKRGAPGGRPEEEPLARMSAAAHTKSPTRWYPNME